MPRLTTATLFTNGRILTGEALLSAPRFVEALLINDGIIVAAGAASTLRAEAKGGTAIVDLEGAFAMPGFNDAHLHLGEGARLHREVDLRGTRSLDEALQPIAAAAKAALPGAWLTGGGWDETLWPGAALPSRHHLDRVTGDRPAVFARIDVHLSVANSAALAVAGVTRTTAAPPGSAIDRDAGGEPTGILRERAARALVEHHIPPATRQQREQSLLAVLRQAAAHGITSVQDNSIDADLAALRALHAEEALPLRISEWLPFDAPLAELEQRRAAPGSRDQNDRFLRTTMLKAFLDGSLGARTAALHAPYSDSPGATGLALYEQEHLNALAAERAAAGFQLGFHAIGDRALDMALTAFAAAAPSYPAHNGGPRFRIEHAQLASPGAFARAAALGAVASIQPCHLLSDARWAGKRLGPERSTRAYAWRSFLAAGVPLALGTDFPVEPLDPFRNLAAAISREPEARETGDTCEAFFPGERLSLAEALHAYTQGSAYAEHAERWKGLLAPGHVADFIVLDRDLLACAGDTQAVRETRVLRSVVDGVTVFTGS